MEDANYITSITAILSATVAVIGLAIQIYSKRKDDLLKNPSLVSCWIDKDYDGYNCLVVLIMNASDLPIYDVIVSVDNSDSGIIQKGNNNCSCIKIVPPGKYCVSVPYSGHGMHIALNSSISFRDNKNKFWTRDSKGILSKNKKSSYETRNITLPVIEAVIEKK